MTTGFDPGALGLYGFRGRADRSYARRRTASSLTVGQPPLWTLLSRHGLHCRVLGVPLTYPPKPLRGRLLSGFLTPSGATPCTHPPQLQQSLEAEYGELIFDVEGFRERDPGALLHDIFAMTDQRFDIAESWVTDNSDPWDFFMMVDMGPDRMHHGFWHYAFADHPNYVPDNPFTDALRRYYRHLDTRLGRLLDCLRPEDMVMVVSDHGAQTMRGGFALNQWLVEQGYLTLTPEASERFARAPGTPGPQDIDWRSTRAWADGGYVGRIHFNVQGREPNGVVSVEAVTPMAETLRAGLGRITTAGGEALAITAQRPEELYSVVHKIAPDLTVSIEDYAYRAIGSVGHPTLWVANNDRGSDGANHARHGVFIMKNNVNDNVNEGQQTGYRESLSIYDIAPTVLHALDCPIPAGMRGHPIV